MDEKAKHKGSDRFSVWRFAFYRDVDSVVRMAQKLLPAVALSASSGNIEMSLLIQHVGYCTSLCLSLSVPSRSILLLGQKAKGNDGPV